MDRMKWSGWMLVAMLWPLALHAARAGNMGHAQSHRESPWSLAPDPAVPEPDATVPGSAAGCVVVGYAVDALGRVHDPQILQGAYTADVDESMQAGFEASVVRAAHRWRHVPSASPTARAPTDRAYEMQTVGFLPGNGASGARAVADAGRQFPALREHCAIADLAQWGETNAVPVHDVAHDEQGVVVRGSDELRLGWVPRGLLQPPDYPREALRRGNSACVVIGFLVQPDGTPTAFRGLDGRYHNHPSEANRKAFVQHAAAAISQWRYSPAPDNLRRTPFYLQVPITFQVDSPVVDLECKRLTTEELAAALQSAERED